MSDSTFVVAVSVPRHVEVEGQALSREDFFSWLWEEFLPAGLVGVHEGTLLSEEAASEGLETDSWTVDAGEAPRERDWVSSREVADAELYFSSEPQAQAAMEALKGIAGLEFGELREQKQQDWDAQWKASFLANPGGVRVQPFWRILPPWVTAEDAQIEKGELILRINPGAGFGTGTHETTQLCLEAIGERAMKRSFKGQPVLDFGSGSGILSIGAALAGGRVDGVEIDPLANDNARENAELNGVSASVTFTLNFGEVKDGARGPYPLVIANILRPVLLEFAGELVKRLDPRGTLILSGLIEKDVEEVVAKYSALLGGKQPQRKQNGEWRALVWDLG